ncbi:MAG TPA: FKBP-type peptidyl-prolyl cis-trans isomerase [Terriglobales bacterium]|nr:FKBP-type peptidyl-prolyl cis-trans isomerase [Terriglobales bacterium]
MAETEYPPAAGQVYEPVSGMGQYRMRKSFVRQSLAAATLLFAAALLFGQQTPAAAPKTASPAKTQKTPAAKTHAAAAARKAPLTLKTQKDKISYAIGMNFGSALHRQSVEVDPAILLQGLKDTMAGGKTLMTDEEARATLTQLESELRKQQMEKLQVEGQANKKEGDDFLAANKTKPGVVTLPSGLQYKVLQAGNGPKPKLTDTVVCNYRGRLINGKEFDSSYKRGQPATFPLNRIIKGWMEALPLMPVGSKWQLFVPPDLAYGDRGAGPDIGPNATLIFEVELLSIQPPQAAPKAPENSQTPPPKAEAPAQNQEQPAAKPPDKK